MATPAQPPPPPSDWLSSAAAGRKILYTPEDAAYLSEPLCILRAQIEAFAATQDDIKARAGRGGMKRESLAVGRVGIRCIHCSHLPLIDRARGAVSYPKSVRIMYQAVRNFQRYHFLKCEQTPAHVKKSFQDSRGAGSQSKKDAQEYWVGCCESMGMVDTGTEGGIRFDPEVSPEDANSTAEEAGREVQQEEQFNSSAGARNDLLVADSAASAASAPLTMETEETSSNGGFLSAMFEQAAGDTAEPPASESGASQKDKLLDLVRVAHGLVKSVREGHDAGIPYDGARGLDGLGVLGGSSPPPLSEGIVRNDLASLGSELYRHFAGVDPFGNGVGLGGASAGSEPTSTSMSSVAEEQPTTKRERRPSSQSYTPLSELGLPISLSILVSNMLDATKDGAVDAYRTAAAIDEDLRLMSADPERYLFDAESSDKVTTGKLTFPAGRLYGRDDQTFKLMHAFGRVIGSGGARELVLLSGYSGTGKSVLAEQLRQTLIERRSGHFISAKFDGMGQVQAMSVIFSAFNDYCRDLLRGDGDVLALVRRALLDSLGTNSNVLTDLIPNLRDEIGEPASSAVQVEGREALNRFLIYYRLFVRAIASPLHPVILFLDDLHWADKASLELISTLLLDREVTSLLFVGSYRSNEVGPDHPLRSEIRKVSSGGVGIVTIELENIDRESVNALVSDTLYLSPRITRSLADIVYAKTSGNPLFAVQFLRSLCDERLLRYSASSRRWEWDVEAIQAKDIADNVVDLMTKKMLSLDSGVQWLLKVAACLGSQSGSSTLKLLSSNGDDDGSGIIPFYDLAVNEGLMSRIGSCYKFSHDQIQQAAYSLIPEGEQSALHLHIGRLLWKKTTESALNDILFIVVDQLHRGSDLISDHVEKVEVARLCLMAGEKAVSSSAFLQASLCLLQGSTLLEDSDWENHYDLSLELFTCCAEAQFACGNFDGATITLDPIMKHGRCLQDKMRAYYTLLSSIGSLGKQQDAIQYGLSVLEQFGESFVIEPTQNDAMNDFGKTQAMLQQTNAGEILKSDEMQDTNKIAIMKLLAICMNYAYHVSQELMGLMISRMVQLSLCHGVCKESSFAFVCFGATMCAFGDFENGYQYGKLAMSLLDRFDAKEHLPEVYAVAYDGALVFNEPMQANLPPVRKAYEIGLSMGNVEWAMTNANIYSVCAIQCGRKLEPLAEELRAYVQQMKEYQHHMLGQTQPYLQAILNLMGGNQDPTNLTGEAMNQDDLLNISHEKQHVKVICNIYVMRMWLAYLFGQYDVAAEMVEACRKITLIAPGGLQISEAFYTGLIAVIMARREDSNEWRTVAHEIMEKINVWAQQSSWNFQHKVDLLRAEIAYNLDRDLEGAAKAYDDSIRHAGEHGFVHEQALACERAGMFHVGTSGASVAPEYFERARMYYLEWGATRKAQDLAHRVVGTE